uniref:Ovule protein n=1 Tax=Romanomermis culicivorax TaxID=13658 RepID=A0A915J8K2_ROMCU
MSVHEKNAALDTKRTSYGDPCYSNTLMKTNNAINIRIFSSKKLYQKKPDPKRPKVKSKLPEIKVWQILYLCEH